RRGAPAHHRLGDARCGGRRVGGGRARGGLARRCGRVHLRCRRGADVRIAAAKRAGRPRANRNALTRGLTPLLLALVSALIVLPTTIVVIFGLMPSFAALVVDEGRPRYLFRTVLGMNIAALLPYV